MLDNFQFHPREWKQYGKYVAGQYKRQLVARNSRFTLFLTVWRSGQTSPIHDHNGSRCWIKVLEGEVEEKLFSVNSTNLQCVETNTITPQAVAFREGDCIHQNHTSVPAASLHLYSPPYSFCRNYDACDDFTLNADHVLPASNVSWVPIATIFNNNKTLSS